MIAFNKDNKVFNITTRNSTYQMMVDEYGYLIHLYYGRRLKDELPRTNNLLYINSGVEVNPINAKFNKDYSLNILPQEVSTSNIGDYRSTTIDVVSKKSNFTLDLKFRTYKIIDGDYLLPDLPSFYNVNKTLIITLADNLAKIRVDVIYKEIEDEDTICRSLAIYNEDEDSIIINKALSINLDFTKEKEFNLMHFYGDVNDEFNKEVIELSHLSYSLSSLKGVTSHIHNPLTILAGKETGEDSGECYLFNLVYSSNFEVNVAKDYYNQVRLNMGIAHDNFSYTLKPKESFFTPEVMMVYSNCGLNDLSSKTRNSINANLVKYKPTFTPLVANTSSSLGYDFSLNALKEYCAKVSKIGVNVVVVDDGWFAKREDKLSGLGDFEYDKFKFGSKFDEFKAYLETLNLKLGLWLEIEAVNEKSTVYKTHPEWIVHPTSRGSGKTNNELMLNLGLKDVQKYLINLVKNIVLTYKLDYLKLDLNRVIESVYSVKLKNQGEFYHEYIKGLYKVLAAIRKAYPDLFIEVGQMGGGRLDLGMMQFASSILLSNSLDYSKNIKMIYNVTYGYPLNMISSKFAKDEGNDNISKLELANFFMSMLTNTVFDIDFAKCSTNAINLLNDSVIQYNILKENVLNGSIYRVELEEKNDGYLVIALSKNKKECTFAVISGENGTTKTNIKFKSLKENLIYTIEEKEYKGNQLIRKGISIKKNKEPYYTYIYSFKGGFKDYD